MLVREEMKGSSTSEPVRLLIKCPCDGEAAMQCAGLRQEGVLCCAVLVVWIPGAPNGVSTTKKSREKNINFNIFYFNIF